MDEVNMLCVLQAGRMLYAFWPTKFLSMLVDSG